MFVSQQALNSWHTSTTLCKKGEELRHLAEEETEAGTAMALTAYSRPLMTVLSLKYTGWVLSALSDNWLAVIQNLWRVRQKWAWLSLVLVREGADVQMSGMFYTVVGYSSTGRRRGSCPCRLGRRWEVFTIR